MTDLEIPIGKRTRSYRFFEILPALLSWMLLSLPVVLAILSPSLAAYFVIIFMVYWMLKAGIMTYRVLAGYSKMQWRQTMHWQPLLDDLSDPETAMARLEKQKPTKEKRWHYHNLVEVNESTQYALTPDEVIHAVIIAMYNESYEIVQPTFKALKESHYDLSKVHVYLAFEERGGDAAAATVKKLTDEFTNDFASLQSVMHPDGMPNEVIGKGGNITFAGLKLQKDFSQQRIDPSKVLVTTLDSDNRVHPSYLSSITYTYIISEDRKYKSFQPIPMYLNNIWDTAAPARLIATGSSFWWAIQSTRPHQLRNFSSHAQPMDALLETNWWSTRTIVEDGHQFWRTYFAFDGKHDVIPTFVPIYQDAVLSDTYRGTLRAQFIQLRRWAWGASDIAYVASKAFFTPNNISFLDKTSKFIRLCETHVSWSTTPLILAGAAWAPILANPDGRDDIVAHQLPGIASYLQTLALIGVPMMIYLTVKILPPRPRRYKKHKSVMMILQWALMPPMSIIYGASSALYSQTRLATGKYLDKFDVTEKVVIKHDD